MGLLYSLEDQKPPVVLGTEQEDDFHWTAEQDPGNCAP